MLIEQTRKNIILFLNFERYSNKYLLKYILYLLVSLVSIMYAVVELQWHQYIVSESWELLVDKLDMNPGDMFDTRVLALFSEDGGSTSLGSPYVDGASVSFKVKDHSKWKKIDVVKFKNKNRYEKHYGHRSHYTLLSVESLNGK